MATASLELGIDIGDVDLVCQIGSPRSIGSFLQRVGRSNHSVTGIPEGRLFPLSRDELVECAALLDSVRRGELDRLVVPDCPLDVLAQQIVAEVAAREWREDELYGLGPPRLALSRADAGTIFVGVVRMLAEGFTTRRGRRGALIHYDAVNGMLRGRSGSRLTALTAGGTIPDNADYQVLLEPESSIIGTRQRGLRGRERRRRHLPARQPVLSHHARRARRRAGRGRPRPAADDPVLARRGARAERRAVACPSRACGPRSARRLADGQPRGEDRELADRRNRIAEPAAAQLVEYLAAGHAALGGLPTHDNIVLERFFDEAGGMQLVIHSPYRQPDQPRLGPGAPQEVLPEIQFRAAGRGDRGQHRPVADHRAQLRARATSPAICIRRRRGTCSIQAMLDAPMFQTRWRRVAAVSLALPRFRGGKKVPPQLARMGAEDLVASVFPDQIACAENLAGEREVPDHPLVEQAIDDCLTEAMDIDGLLAASARRSSPARSGSPRAT